MRYTPIHFGVNSLLFYLHEVSIATACCIDGGGFWCKYVLSLYMSLVGMTSCWNVGGLMLVSGPRFPPWWHWCQLIWSTRQATLTSPSQVMLSHLKTAKRSTFLHLPPQCLPHQWLWSTQPPSDTNWTNFWSNIMMYIITLACVVFSRAYILLVYKIKLCSLTN